MFTAKASDGSNNECGSSIAFYRRKLGLSQRALADRLIYFGLDFHKNVIQQIESKERFVTEIELKRIAMALNVTVADLDDTKGKFLEMWRASNYG